MIMPKKTTQCPRPGLEPGPLAPGTSALTMRPPRLPVGFMVSFFFIWMIILDLYITEAVVKLQPDKILT